MSGSGKVPSETKIAC